MDGTVCWDLSLDLWGLKNFVSLRQEPNTLIKVLQWWSGAGVKLRAGERSRESHVENMLHREKGLMVGRFLVNISSQCLGVRVQRGQRIRDARKYFWHTGKRWWNGFNKHFMDMECKILSHDWQIFLILRSTHSCWSASKAHKGQKTCYYLSDSGQLRQSSLCDIDRHRLRPIAGLQRWCWPHKILLA